MRQLSIGNRTWNIRVLGAGLFALSAGLRYHALAQTDFANGWDGYFYLVQLKSLEETGKMHTPEASLIYPYLRLFYWFTSDYVVSLKAGSAVLAGLFTWLTFWLSFRILPESDVNPSGPDTQPDYNWPVSGALLSVFSPHLTYFGAQFPKNLLGMVLLLGFMASLPKNSDRSASLKTWAMPLLFLMINYFGHRLTFVLAVLYLAFWLFFRFGNDWKRGPVFRTFVVAALAGTGVLLMAGLFFPGLFQLVDLGRLKGTLSAAPHFAPRSFVLLFGPSRISGWWMAEIACATAVWGWLAGNLLTKGIRPFRTYLTYPLLGLGTVLLFPFLEWSLTGIAYRLFLVFVLITPLLVIDIQFLNKGRTGVIFAAILFFSSFFSWKSYRPRWHDPDYALFAATTTNARRYLSDKSPELIIAHNALAEFYTFTTGTDAMPWLPEYDIDSTRLWRIASDVSVPSMRYYAGSGYETMIKPLGFRYILVPEYVWKRALDRAKQENDDVFLAGSRNWRNPSQVRPDWLLHRKRKF